MAVRVLGAVTEFERWRDGVERGRRGRPQAEQGGGELHAKRAGGFPYYPNYAVSYFPKIIVKIETQSILQHNYGSL